MLYDDCKKEIYIQYTTMHHSLATSIRTFSFDWESLLLLKDPQIRSLLFYNVWHLSVTDTTFICFVLLCFLVQLRLVYC